MSSNIVILGAGFSGLTAAKKIKKSLKDAAKIMIIDPKDHFLFTPRLIDALEHGMTDPHEIASIKNITERHSFQHVKGFATLVKRDEHLVVYHDLAKQQSTSLAYDVLIICCGARPAFYNIAGAEQHSLPLKTKDDVRLIQAHMRRQAEEKKLSSVRNKTLSLVVVGAGATGIEALFALQTYSQWPINLTLLQAAPEILPGFPTRLVATTLQELRQQGVHIHVGDPVVRVEEEWVETARGLRVPADVVVWAAGIEPNLIPITPETVRDRAGCLIVDRFLRIEERIFAAGDAITYRERDLTIPKNAQTAMRMGQHLASNVVRMLNKQPLKVFHYRSKGTILVLGKTGIINFRLGNFKSRLVPSLRNLFYTLRYWQIVNF